MTRKLEETLDLPRLDEALRAVQEREKALEKQKEHPPTTADEYRAAIEQSMSMDDELLTPSQIQEHDRQLDTIAEKSMSTFDDLRDLGFNIEAKHSGPIFESMVNILRLSMDARNAKVEKKLRMIKMQLDRERLELQKKTAAKNENILEADDDEVFVDRNRILDLLPNAQSNK